MNVEGIERVVVVVAAVENDVLRNIESIDLSLQGVIEGLQRPDIWQLSPDLRQVVLFDRSATARHLGLILVTDAAGNVLLDSRTTDLKTATTALTGFSGANIRAICSSAKSAINASNADDIAPASSRLLSFCLRPRKI